MSEDRPEQPEEAVLFKMPPYFEFQTTELIETAREFLAADVLRMPFKFCHFETDFVLRNVNMKIRIEAKIDNGFYFVRFSGKKRKHDEYKLIPVGVKIKPGDEEYEFFVDEKEAAESLKNERLDDDAARLFTQAFLACLMCVNMREFEQKEIVASEKTQAAREKKGRPRKVPYILVSLKSEHRAALGSGSGQKTPHWRRGHLRHLSSGVVVPVSPCMVNWRGDVVEPKEYRVKAA